MVLFCLKRVLLYDLQHYRFQAIKLSVSKDLISNSSAFTLDFFTLIFFAGLVHLARLRDSCCEYRD